MRNPPFVDDFRIEPSSSSPCLMTKGYTPFWKKLSHNSGRKTVFSTRTSGILAQASCKTSTRSAASPLVLVAAAAAADDDDDDDHGNLVHWLILYICFYMFLYIYILYIYVNIVHWIWIPWSDLAIPWNVPSKYNPERLHVSRCFLCKKYFMGFTVIDCISMYLRYIMLSVVLWDSKSYPGSCWLPATRPCPKPAFYKLSGSQTWLAGKSVIWFDVFSS